LTQKVNKKVKTLHPLIDPARYTTEAIFHILFVFKGVQELASLGFDVSIAQSPSQRLKMLASFQM